MGGEFCTARRAVPEAVVLTGQRSSFLLWSALPPSLLFPPFRVDTIKYVTAFLPSPPPPSQLPPFPPFPWEDGIYSLFPPPLPIAGRGGVTRPRGDHESRVNGSSPKEKEERRGWHCHEDAKVENATYCGRKKGGCCTVEERTVNAITLDKASTETDRILFRATSSHFPFRWWLCPILPKRGKKMRRAGQAKKRKGPKTAFLPTPLPFLPSPFMSTEAFNVGLSPNSKLSSFPPFIEGEVIDRGAAVKKLPPTLEPKLRPTNFISILMNLYKQLY